MSVSLPVAAPGGGVIAAGHAKTAEAACLAFEAGGNAFDATVAALLMSFVCEPCMSSPGGGGFAVVAPAGGEALVYDFFCQTPGQKRPMDELDFYPVTVDFGTSTEDFHVGMASIAVPGSVAGLFALYEIRATLPLETLAAPALKAAREGVEIDWFQAFDFVLLEGIIAIDPRSQPRFYPEGHLLREGEVQRLPDLARFLEALVREGRDLFYRGEIAQTLAQACAEGGGHLTVEDLARYEVIRRRPLVVEHHSSSILTNPFPSTGGAVIVLSLREMDALRRAGHEHTLYRTFSELDKLPKTAERLRLRLGDLASGVQAPGIEVQGGTTHFSVMDVHGNAVSLSISNGEGGGYFIPGTDVQVNNMLGEAALFPEGFHRWPEDTRLSSMMAPTVVLDGQGRATIALGSGGAGRIPFAITQVMHNILDRDMAPEVAIGAPRLHIVGGEANIEAGFDEGRIPPGSTEHLVRWEEPNMYFGGVHAVARYQEALVGQGDPRRNGAVQGAQPR